MIRIRLGYTKLFKKEYEAWTGAKSRCSNPKSFAWKYYGGRGISFCEKWRNSFQDFLNDVGPAPKKTDTLDRINNNGNYEPGNVRWVSKQKNLQNKRNAHLITFRGQTRHLWDWCERLKLNYNLIERRLNGYKMNPEQALTKPVGGGKFITFRGENHNMDQWAKKLHILPITIQMRFRRGWPVEKVLTTPVHRCRRGMVYTYKGKTLTVAEWAKHFEIDYRIMHYRIHAVRSPFQPYAS
jgi:hypothetical protein